MENFRETLITRLKHLFESNPSIHAVWEGGSAATGFLDELSDLDLGLICDDDAIERVFEHVETFLAEQYGIQKKNRLPEPTWHGHSQCFYILKRCPPLFYIDLLVMKLSGENRLVESDRHGQAQIWFDHKALLDTSPTPPEEILKKGKAFYQETKDAFDLMVIEVHKQLRRNNKIDAMAIYHRAILGRLAAAFNLKYRPAKYDFGLRYANRDYPPEIVALLEDLIFVPDFDKLPEKLDLAVKSFYDTMAEIQPTWEAE